MDRHLEFINNKIKQLEDSGFTKRKDGTWYYKTKSGLIKDFESFTDVWNYYITYMVLP